MKHKHIQLISLLINYLSTHADDSDLMQYLIYNGIKYPEKEMRALTLDVQERTASFE